jgi:Immunoglobulin-like domain of bacterial spore germination
MRLLARLGTLILPLALSACALPPGGALPAATPTAASTEIGPVPTDAPALAEPSEAIQITAPGPASRLVSPLTVQAVTALPAFENVLTLRVLLDDGADLVPPQAVVGSGPEGGPLTFEATLTFEVGEERPAFVQAYLVSPRDGGVTHLASVAVTVLPGGAAELQPARKEKERLQILAPMEGDSISGGTVHVEGIGIAGFEQTLLIEVLDAEGEVIGLQPVLVKAPDFGLPGPFAAEVAYALTAAGAGRVVVRDISPAHGSDVHRSSVEVNLAP